MVATSIVTEPALPRAQESSVGSPSFIPSSDAVASFFDRVLEERFRLQGARIRRVTSQAALEELGRARLRMYAQRGDYFRSLFPPTGTDDVDRVSYVFACYQGGTIIGSQRVTPAPFEVGQHVTESALAAFLGDGYAQTYVEFSRLVVDRHSSTVAVATSLGAVAGLCVLFEGYERYITYSRPQLKRRSFAAEADTLRFRIPARNNNEYELVKGKMVDSARKIFRLKDRSDHDVVEILRARIENDGH